MSFLKHFETSAGKGLISHLATKSILSFVPAAELYGLKSI